MFFGRAGLALPTLCKPGSDRVDADHGSEMTGGTADVAARLGIALADRYRIERELGAGGMATVYLASDLRHDRKVAIKVLRGGDAAVDVERFHREIRVLAR